MKITIEKEEWQLLGQLALEVSECRYPQGSSLSAVLLWEFRREHAAAFEVPQRRKRKLRLSTALGIYSFLKRQESRNDPFWDVILIQLTEKVFKAIKQ